MDKNEPARLTWWVKCLPMALETGGSIPGQIIPKTMLDAALLNTQHYKVRIKDKVLQYREKNIALPYTSKAECSLRYIQCLWANVLWHKNLKIQKYWKKGTFGLLLSMVTNITYLHDTQVLHLALDSYLIMLSAKQGRIKYHFLSLWYDSTWDWTLVSWAIGEHSTKDSKKW